jgi:dihydrofolate synthase / folylpolyglutamate synthase
MDLQASLNKLYSLHTFGIKLGLENITKFLNVLANPHTKIKTIHVAGSNGKGSTSAFIASILMELGYSTGIYTSPHFVRFNERIIVDGDEIPDDYLGNFIRENERYIDEFGLTFFEVATAMAFKYFYDKKVDYAVIETGLGGRLDATNVIIPVASVITSISLEHTEILGSTIAKIAGEKAEIIKQKSKVFIGKLPRQAIKVIAAKCKSTGSELFKIEEYIVEKKGVVELYTEEVEIDEWNIPLKGFYQKLNAALAGLCITKTLGTDNPNYLLNGIKNVIQNKSIHGRYEYFNRTPDIILDSAHNPEGLKNFLSEFKKEPGYKKRYLLFGVMKDKAISEMLKMVSGIFDEIRVSDIKYERASTSKELKDTAEKIGIPVITESNPADYIKWFAANGKPEECLVVLGSMYLLGEIKSSFSNNLT